MPDRDQGTLLPPARRQTLVLRGKVRLLRFRGSMRNFDKDLPEPAAPFAGLAAQALAPALMVVDTIASGVIN